jgi:hypothetical protein
MSKKPPMQKAITHKWKIKYSEKLRISPFINRKANFGGGFKKKLFF